jgi:hypothetical protein
VGPTLPATEVQERIACICLGPAAQGDVYRATLRRPKAIVVIDGYFEHVCSVWHKEILWAIRQGIPVFGSSSMGALRAAELDRFGMVGVGAIYEDFRDGVLEDDDEVTVLHGPERSAYAVATEAMVNIRSTLRAAVAAGVVSEPTAAVLLRLAKSLHYTRRRWDAVLGAAEADAAVPAPERELLRDWLPTGRIDQKREDALALLDRVRDHVFGDPQPAAPAFDFEYTTLFDDLRRRAGELDFRRSSTGERLLTDAVLDEVRLAGRWPEMCMRAVARRLAREDARRQRLEVSERDLVDAVIEMRERRNLLDPEDLDRWVEEANLRGVDFVRLMEDEVLVRRVFDALDPELGADLLDLIRLDGTYAEFVDRAVAKREIFAAIDADPPEPGVYEQARRQLAGDSSVETAMRELGFRTQDAFNRASIGELLYVEGDSW